MSKRAKNSQGGVETKKACSESRSLVEWCTKAQRQPDAPRESRKEAHAAVAALTAAEAPPSTTAKDVASALIPSPLSISLLSEVAPISTADAPKIGKRQRDPDLQKKKEVSWWWNFVSDVEEKDVPPDALYEVQRCKICDVIIKLNMKSSAANIESHLMKHLGACAPTIKDTDKTPEYALHLIAKLRSTPVRPLDSFFSALPRVTSGNLAQTARRELALVMWATACGIPFEAFTTPEWQQLLDEWKINVCQGDQLRKRVQPTLAALLNDALQKRLAGVRSIALTSDGWSRNGLGLVSLTASWVDEAWQFHTIPLTAMKREGSETAEALRELWSKSLDLSVLPPDIFAGMITTDAGANFLAGARLLCGPDGSWRCVAHALNNVAQKVEARLDAPPGMPTLPNTVTHLFDRVSQFVNFVHKSPQRTDEFKMAQVMNLHEEMPRLIMPGVTRWFSRYLMAERYVKDIDDVRRFIGAGLANHLSTQPADFVITDVEIKQLSAILNVLKPIYILLTKVQATSTPTLCCVCGWFQQLYKEMAPDNNDSPITTLWKETLVEELKQPKRFGNLFHGDSLAMRAALFHPIYANLPFHEMGVTSGVRDKVWALGLRDARLVLNVPETPPSPGGIFDELDGSSLENKWQQYRELVEGQHELLVSRFGDNPIKFWKDAAAPTKKFHLLANPARFWLATQASSAASESLWSMSSYTVQHRSMLAGETIALNILMKWCIRREGFDFDSLATELIQRYQTAAAHK